MLQIDILTVVGHEHPELMSLTHFGHFYAGNYLLTTMYAVAFQMKFPT